MLVTLTVAGSDSIGGAGIEADIKAMGSQGVHAAVALTAVTAQNTAEVAGIFPLEPSQVVAQIDAVLFDIHVSAAKTGMLYSAAIASAVADRLKRESFPVVVDPVLVAGVGDPLNREDLVEAIRTRMAPLATIITPNVPEAEALVGYEVREDAELRRACRDLADLGAEAVLLKGGHLSGPTVTDLFYYNGKFLHTEAARVDVRGHGGGCVLSSLLTVNLAKGMGLWEAVLTAKTAVDRAVRSNYPVGRGVPIVDPLGQVVKDAQRYDVSRRLIRCSREVVDLLPREWIPEVGTNVVFALPGAERPEDVCGLESRIVARGTRAACAGGVDFGASRNLSKVVLAAMASDGGVRAAMNLRFNEENLRKVQRAGLSVGSFKRGKGAASDRTTEQGTEDTINTLGFVPDTVYDTGGPGMEPMMRLLGRSPEELLTKLKRIIA
jgi:hydroxymethylpyrimidine kinase/phosphomethylpyrimidine kinase